MDSLLPFNTNNGVMRTKIAIIVKVRIKLLVILAGFDQTFDVKP